MLVRDESLDGHGDVVDTHAGQVRHAVGDVVPDLLAGAGDVAGVRQVQGHPQAGRPVVHGGLGAGCAQAQARGSIAGLPGEGFAGRAER